MAPAATPDMTNARNIWCGTLSVAKSSSGASPQIAAADHAPMRNRAIQSAVSAW